MVAPFLFYSGYGIFESIKNKGDKYIQSFPKKRILKTLIHFDFAIFLYLLLDILIGKDVSIQNFILSLIAWESIGNSNWFIFAILLAYFSTFLGMKLFFKDLKKIIIFVLLFSLIYICIIFYLKEGYWVDTMLAYPLGCLLSLYKDKVQRVISKKIGVLGCFILCVATLVFSKTNYIPSLFVRSQIALIAFLPALFILTLHLKISNKLLCWFGGQTFGIYILQRLPMNSLSYFYNINEKNYHLFFFISFLSTLILSVLFTKINKIFDSKFLNG